jgi:hypothetical protein
MVVRVYLQLKDILSIIDAQQAEGAIAEGVVKKPRGSQRNSGKPFLFFN